MIISINTESKREVHVCYFTLDGLEKNTIRLMEVVEAFYDHPDAQGLCDIPQFETRFIKVFNRLDYDAGVVILLEANQKAVHYDCKKVLS